MNKTSRLGTAINLLASLSILLAPMALPAAEEVEPYPDAMTGRTAPAFSVQGIYGETYSSDQFRGKPLILIFGTSW